MKKKTLYGVIAVIFLMAAVIFSIYLYEKYTVRFSTVSFEDIEFQKIDFWPSRQE